MSLMHAPTCACCGDLLTGRFDRRAFLKAAGGAGMVAAFPFAALAAEGNYEAMLGKYSQFVIAGASIGVVAPTFQDWHKAFWDNLAASIQLHHIPKVIALDHRDCGAAKIAYGPEKVANPEVETETHRAALMELRRQMGERQPKLAVETGLMALDGKVEMFA